MLNLTKKRIAIGMVYLAVLVAVVFYLVPPSSWLIPDKFDDAFYSDACYSSAGFDKPQTIQNLWWRWLEARGGFAVPALKTGMRQGTDNQRIGCTVLLGRKADSALTSEFENALEHDRNDQVRIWAALALVHIGSPEARIILEKLTEKKNYQAFRYLGLFHDKQSAPVLIRLLRTGHVETSLIAIGQLKAIYGEELIPQLHAWFVEGAITIDDLNEITHYEHMVFR